MKERERELSDISQTHEGEKNTANGTPPSAPYAAYPAANRAQVLQEAKIGVRAEVVLTIHGGHFYRETRDRYSGPAWTE